MSLRTAAACAASVEAETMAGIFGRKRMDYTARTEARAFEGFSPDHPIAGYYRTRLRSGGVSVGVRIFYGAPKDPVTGEIMDRSHRWQAEVNGFYVEMDTVWPKCAADRIDRAEYDYLTQVQSWAVTNAPDSPQANPRRKINPLTAPMPF